MRVANPIFVLFLFITSFYGRSVCAWVVIQIACGTWSSFILYSNAFVMVRLIFFFVLFPLFEYARSHSYKSINDEIILVSIIMGITILVLITIALCYIAYEKCQKKREYYINA
ncbi:uncharacterized protein LOC6620387 isoform X2 [Drosophila sechellia]|uniref:uncharacterized protein LOC6620387 isoform X2 n=1 Tax=Drosophila sechellia TaxID=7238 RepID=UPI0013DE48B6|nr:uncharacterized protein LOC6620387 isoform X2 [Drosophila sechellia]